MFFMHLITVVVRCFIVKGKNCFAEVLSQVVQREHSMQNLIRQLCNGDLWLPWLPLRKGEMKISKGEGGLYRIRMRKTCIYIGETENFKRRLEQELLRSLQVETMPDGEHHTAAPRLWHLQQTYGNESLQVSPVSANLPYHQAQIMTLFQAR
jgi:hypothetical protein